MITFIMVNIGTILVGILVAALVAGIVFKMVKDKKNGKSSCSCGCEGCPNSSACHKDK